MSRIIFGRRRRHAAICSRCGSEIVGEVYRRMTGDLLCEDCLAEEYDGEFEHLERSSLRAAVEEDPEFTVYESSEEYDRAICEDIAESAWRESEEADLL